MRNISTLTYLVIKSALFSDDTFDPEDLRMISDDLSKFKASPSDRVIQSILNFAKAYEVIKSESAGDVEMILN